MGGPLPQDALLRSALDAETGGQSAMEVIIAVCDALAGRATTASLPGWTPSQQSRCWPPDDALVSAYVYQRYSPCIAPDVGGGGVDGAAVYGCLCACIQLGGVCARRGTSAAPHLHDVLAAFQAIAHSPPALQHGIARAAASVRLHILLAIPHIVQVGLLPGIVEITSGALVRGAVAFAAGPELGPRIASTMRELARGALIYMKAWAAHPAEVVQAAVVVAAMTRNNVLPTAHVLRAWAHAAAAAVGEQDASTGTSNMTGTSSNGLSRLADVVETQMSPVHLVAAELVVTHCYLSALHKGHPNPARLVV